MAEFVHRVMEVQVEQINTGKYYFWDPLAAAIADGEVSATRGDDPVRGGGGRGG